MQTTPEPKARTAWLLWFTVPVTVVGLAMLGQSVLELRSLAHAPTWVALVSALVLLSSSFTLCVPGIAAQVSISETFLFASVLLFGPAPATVTLAVDSLLISRRRGHSAQQLWFNPAASAASVWAGAHVYYLLARAAPLADDPSGIGSQTLIPLAALVIIYFLLNSGLTSLAVGLEQGISPVQVWRRHFAILSLSNFAAASGAFFLILLWHYAGIAAIAAVTPLICIFHVAIRSWLGRVADTERHLSAMNRLYLSTIGAFSTAIEAKDGVTCDHIHRVQAYALGLARAMGITDPRTLQALEAAALLHDTGKLAVPEHILNKPGKLTEVEFEQMKLHVDVGVDILSAIDFPYPVVPIVQAHHENWDGTGYPAGVRGEEIPIGARILSVVDCYDALTSDRPYRSAMTEAQAVAIVLERRGTMYDPMVVDTFVRVYQTLAPAVAQRPELLRAFGLIKGARTAAPLPSAVGSAARPSSNESRPEGALALEQLARTVSRTASLQDVGALAWTHLRDLAPQSTLSLYVVEPGRGLLVAGYTAGPAANFVAHHTIAVGSRLTGWAAANRQTIVNGCANLDLQSVDVEQVKFATALPLCANGTLMGVVTLYSPALLSDSCTQTLEALAPSLTTLVEAASHPLRNTAAEPIARSGSRARSETALRLLATS